VVDSTQVRDAALAITGIGVLVAALQILPSRVTQSILDPNDGPSRLESLDGLRGFLAIGVVVTHAWSNYDFYYAGLGWNWPHNPYFVQCGSLAVPIFFMITGFLFWTKSRVAKGRIRILPHYLNRARRILPLYYFLCICVVSLAMLRAHWPLTDPKHVVSQVLSLAVPGRFPSGPIAGTERFHLMNSAWTLYYEVAFYLALPLFAPMARTRRLAFCFLAIIVVLLAVDRVLVHSYKFSFLSFWVGFVVSELLDRYPDKMALLRGRTLAVCAAVGLLFLPLLTHGSLNPLSFGCASLVFAMVAAGNDMLGLLVLRGTRLLGTVSYSVYLMHMFILAIVLGGLNEIHPLSGLSTLSYGAVVAGITFVVVGFSMFSYRFIEYPWLRRQRPVR
jgi:peptidoglycan/LPS O-acetylase OafA/YrhL